MASMIANADWQVDEKEPAPRGGLQDSASNHRAEYRPQHDGHGSIADDARHMFSSSARCHHLRHWRQQSAAHALQDSKSDQCICRPGDAACSASAPLRQCAVFT
jgi:hypothetical protein